MIRGTVVVVAKHKADIQGAGPALHAHDLLVLISKHPCDNPIPVPIARTRQIVLGTGN